MQGRRRFLHPVDDMVVHFEASGAQERNGRMRVPYGPTPGQTLDIFPAKAPGSPIDIFVHGGFWRFLDSFDHTLVAPAVLDAGGASILLNYDLCPKVPLTEVVRQVRAALKWVWDHADEANGDRDKIYISGHSAGGHLASMMCTGDFNRDFGLPDDPVKGATIVSAMLDLEPVMLVPGAEELLVPDDAVRALSPRYNPPTPPIRRSSPSPVPCLRHMYIAMRSRRSTSTRPCPR